MLSKKQTPGFIGGLIGFGLGLAISFTATVAIRGAYNKSADEINSEMRIDELGIAYRAMLHQDHTPQTTPLPKFKSSNNEVAETCSCITETP